MRTFVGVELDPSARSAAAGIAAAFRRAIVDARINIDARWVPEDNLHITLWFIGEVADGRAGLIQAALSPAFVQAPFDLHLAGLGAFPGSGAPRVFWIGLRAGAREMLALNAEVGARLAPLAIEPERRAYSAHLTLARVKDVAGRSDADRIQAMMRQLPAEAGRSRVTAVTLFRSRPSPKGSTYEPLLRVPLG